MDRLRIFLARWLFSPLHGVTWGDWLRVLADNRFAVGVRFWPRALLTTLASPVNSLQARREERRHGAAIRATRVHDPIFILGHYRSGTTHLHNLLAQDGRFATLNNYQANFPRTFLSTENLGARLGAALTMRRRPHDDVKLDLRVPTEDELALCVDTFLSPHMAWHFPRRAEHYERRYLTMREASESERRRWVASLRTLAAKLTYKYERPLVFKSPLHTARISLILEAFPGARFVHVHRDPFRVFQSTRHMETRVEPLFRYQASRPERLDDRILWRYSTLYDAYLADRSRIAPGRLVEIAYRDLDRDPLATVARVYAALGMPNFAVAQPALRAYVDDLTGYRRNRYPPLDGATVERIRRNWQRFFEVWAYPTRPGVEA